MTKFYFTESQSFVKYSHVYTCIYYVCGIKRETKVMHLHKIRIEKIIVSSTEVCCQLLLTITCNIPSQPV